jgi:hypothetical protein
VLRIEQPVGKDIDFETIKHLCAEKNPMTVHIRKHEAVPDCGSYEVKFPDGGPVYISIGTTTPAADPLQGL